MRLTILLMLTMYFTNILTISTVSNIREKEFSNKEIKNGVVYSKGETTPYTGKFIDNNLTEEYNYGVKDGFFKGTFIEKNVEYSYEGRYVEGIKHGEWVIKYPSGKRRAVIKYNYDRPYGKWIYFYENNKIEGYENFKNGVLNGEVAEFDENGDKSISANYKNGLLNGDMYIFENSFVKIKSFFCNGKLNGKINIFSKEGKLLVDGIYKDDSRENKWKFFYQNGELKTVVSYLNGKRHGQTLIYDTGGTLVEELYFKDGYLIDLDKSSDSLKEKNKRIKDDILENFKIFNRNLKFIKYNNILSEK